MGLGFLLNVPFIVVSLTAVGILVPESRDPRRRPLDPAGAALATAGLGILVYGIIQEPVAGWSGIVVGALGAGALLLACFALWETRNPQPMLDLRLFASARFTRSVWGAFGAAVLGF